MYSSFNLTLMVQHACNLSCSYCYTGRKFHRAMPLRTGSAAIERAINSIEPRGTLELGFFGGEPLIEAELILSLVEIARDSVFADAKHLHLSLTTNATIATPAAWRVMAMKDLQLHVSHDGLPEIHDRHRGLGTSDKVLDSIQRLIEMGREVRVIMVVRPDTVEHLADGIRWLKEHGVSHVDPSLDLWTEWSQEDAQRLENAVRRCANLWRDSLPDFGISWFDDKLARLLKTPMNTTARCGFGNGQIAVAPSGNLYPCERLIGEDKPDNPMRMPGHVDGGDDFLNVKFAHREIPDVCTSCAIQEQCGTFCRCSNLVRTGDANMPDGLLCLLDQSCFRETRRVAEDLVSADSMNLYSLESCHV